MEAGAPRPTPPSSQSYIDALDNEMVSILEANGQVETAAGNAQRQRALGDVKDELIQWLTDCYPEQHPDRSHVQLQTSGSYRLGAHSKGSDIDTVILLRNYVDLRDFYGLGEGDVLDQQPKPPQPVPAWVSRHVSPFIERIRRHAAFMHETSVTAARVPLIKCQFRGFDLDLIPVLVADWAYERFLQGQLNIISPEILISVPPPSVRAIDGPRHAMTLLQIAKGDDPHQEEARLSAFRTLVRFVKIWAKARGVYENVNVLGGIGWSVLATRVLQLNPDLAMSPVSLIAAFFYYYASYDWSEPVIVVPDPPMPEVIPSQYELVLRESFSRMSPRRNQFPMVILTPCFPRSNIAFNSRPVVMAHLTEEFKRGKDIMANILRGEATFADLLSKWDFASDCKLYAIIQVRSQSAQAAEVVQRLVLRSGVVENITRMQIQMNPELERRFNVQITRVCLHPDVIVSSSSASYATSRWVGFDVEQLPDAPPADMHVLIEALKQGCQNVLGSIYNKNGPPTPATITLLPPPLFQRQPQVAALRSQPGLTIPPSTAKESMTHIGSAEAILLAARLEERFAPHAVDVTEEQNVVSIQKEENTDDFPEDSNSAEQNEFVAMMEEASE